MTTHWKQLIVVIATLLVPTLGSYDAHAVLITFIDNPEGTLVVTVDPPVTGNPPFVDANKEEAAYNEIGINRYGFMETTHASVFMTEMGSSNIISDIITLEVTCPAKDPGTGRCINFIDSANPKNNIDFVFRIQFSSDVEGQTLGDHNSVNNVTENGQVQDVTDSFVDGVNGLKVTLPPEIRILVQSDVDVPEPATLLLVVLGAALMVVYVKKKELPTKIAFGNVKCITSRVYYCS